MKVFQFAAQNELDTERFGRELVKALPERAMIALVGTLGAGKTRLVQAVAAADGFNRDAVTSPTFVMCQEYPARHMIYHVDAYRIRDEDEWFELGMDELFTTTAWVFVEWGDRFRELLPDERLQIEIEITSDTGRSFKVLAWGEALEAAIEKLQQANIMSPIGPIGPIGPIDS